VRPSGYCCTLEAYPCPNAEPLWLLPPGPATNHNFLILIYPNTKQRACPAATSALSIVSQFHSSEPLRLPASVDAQPEKTRHRSPAVPGTVLSGTLSALQIPSSPPSTAASCIGCSGLLPHPSGGRWRCRGSFYVTNAPFVCLDPVLLISE
jgi:hypothetical protein